MKKGVSSFIVSGRRTYIDVLTKPFVETTQAAGSGYYFYDLNAKYNHRFSPKDEVFLSGYFGRDVFSFNSADAGFGASIPWGNAMASARWNHVINDKLFLNVNAAYSNYEFSFESGQDDFQFGFESGVVRAQKATQLVSQLAARVRCGLDHVSRICPRRSSSPRGRSVRFGSDRTTTKVNPEDGDVSDALRVMLGCDATEHGRVRAFAGGRRTLRYAKVTWLGDTGTGRQW